MLAAWLLALPFRVVARLGVRGSVVLACLGVLAVSAYGAAGDLGLLDPPASARPGRRSPAPGGPPSRAATADIPPGYLALYRQAAPRCPGLSWTILAGIGKVESDHGRAPLPGVRAGWNHAGAAGPMQFGIGTGRAGNAWARFGHDHDRDGRVSVYDPGDAIPAAARYLCAHGAPAAWTRRCTPTTPPRPTSRGSSSSPAATPQGVGGGERPDHHLPGPGAGLDAAGLRGLLRRLRHRAGPPH